MAGSKLIVISLISLGLFCLSNASIVKRQARPCPDDCADKPLDISLIVDCSSSIGPDNYTIGLWFVQNFVSKFNIAPDMVRVSMVSYSIRVFEEDAFNYNDYTDKVALGNAISEMPYRYGNKTETGMAIRWYMDNQYPLTRPGVRHVLIVLTDGNSQEWEITQNEAANALSQGLEIFAVGVGKYVSFTELHNIASDDRHVFLVQQYGFLEHVSSRLAFEVCDVPVDPPCSFDPVDLTFVIDSSVSIGESNFTLQLEFIKEFVEDFEINPSSVRVAAVMFGDKVYEDSVIYFQSYNNKKDIVDAIKGLTWQHSEETKTSAGIDYMVDVIGADYRSHAAHVGIVLTDGWSQDTRLTAASASRARASGIEMIAVGIGKLGVDLDESELLSIAGSPGNVMTADDFNLLNSLRDKLIKTTCSGIESNFMVRQAELLVA